MTVVEIEVVLQKHLLWLAGAADGERANLHGANLCEADLQGANLCEADLCEADLCGANLCGANLCGANLCGANLYWADLCGANLCGANLCGVRYNYSTASFNLVCPESGAYIAYKKVVGFDDIPVIAKLQIPEDALRSSATTRKCRASKAIVLSLENIDGTPYLGIAHSRYDSTFIYAAGAELEVKDFDLDRWKECAAGIHHFITRHEAEMWDD
jgi:hypothetical protein